MRVMRVTYPGFPLWISKQSEEPVEVESDEIEQRQSENENSPPRNGNRYPSRERHPPSGYM